MTELRTTPSVDGYEQTVARLDAELDRRGLPVFARADHAANAESVGLAMPPTLVVTFGNPRGGTPLMLAAPDLALDLPLRLLVRETDHGVELVFADPAALIERHGLPPAAGAALAATLDDVVAVAAGGPVAPAGP